jgi:hypothetical protein
MAYLDWCKAVSGSPDPKSRLHGEFMEALEKCKLAEGETVVGLAFNSAKEKPLPPDSFFRRRLWHVHACQYSAGMCVVQ